MISEGSFTNDPGRQTRIERIVEKETRRRKRLLILYGLFLVIPFGVGVGFLMYGHSDREVLKIEREVLKTEVNRRLAPVEATIEQTEPALQLVRDIVSAQEERLDRLSQEQHSLIKLDETLIAGKEGPIQSLEKELADMDNRLTLQDKLLAALVDGQEAIKNEQARINSEVDMLADRVSALQQTSSANVLQEHTIMLERLQGELRLLTKRKKGR